MNFVSRSDINISKKGTSKYDPLLEALHKLQPGGKALEVTFGDESELSSMRNVVYAFNKEHDVDIKSSKHINKNVVYFFKEK